MIRSSILISTDPCVFCPDVLYLSSLPKLHSFRHLTPGYPYPERTRPDISLRWLLPPQTLYRSTIILISPSPRAGCPDRSLTFSILSVHSYIISTCPHHVSQTCGELSQLCLTQSRSCGCFILFFPMSSHDIYSKVTQTAPCRVPFIDSTTSTPNAQIFLYVLRSTHHCQKNSINYLSYSTDTQHIRHIIS